MIVLLLIGHLTYNTLSPMAKSVSSQKLRSPRDPAARRAEILAAAERLLVEQGAAFLTMRAVALAAGVSLGHLQHYFAHRDGLLLGLAQLWADRFRAGFGRRLGPKPSPQDLMNAFADEVLAEVETPEGSLGIWEFWIAAARDAETARIANGLYRPIYQAFAEALAAAGIADAPMRARLIVGMVEGTTMLAAHDGKPAALRRKLRPALHAAIRTLATTPPDRG
jgi:AcrR family transcriptional regulator